MNHDTARVRWKKVSLLGVGLLGGSLGKAVKQRRLAELVAGYVRRAASVRECERLGAVDFATCDLPKALAGADLVVLCTPVAQMLPLVQRMLPFLEPGAIVTDVGSVKHSVVRELERLVANADAHFVGSHPMAGSEQTGVSAAQADLFFNAVCVLTPTRRTNPAALRKVEKLWKDVGARLLRLSPEAHDRFVSRSSHLPYVVAAHLANFALNPTHPKAQVQLCANGFRDTTRVASGSPEMWRDIVLANREYVLRGLTELTGDLRAFKRMLTRADSQSILRLFQEAKRRRDAWLENGVPAPGE